MKSRTKYKSIASEILSADGQFVIGGFFDEVKDNAPIFEDNVQDNNLSIYLKNNNTNIVELIAKSDIYKENSFVSKEYGADQQIDTGRTDLNPDYNKLKKVLLTGEIIYILKNTATFSPGDIEIYCEFYKDVEQKTTEEIKKEIDEKITSNISNIPSIPKKNSTNENADGTRTEFTFNFTPGSASDKNPSYIEVNGQIVAETQNAVFYDLTEGVEKGTFNNAGGTAAFEFADPPVNGASIILKINEAAQDKPDIKDYMDQGGEVVKSKTFGFLNMVKEINDPSTKIGQLMELGKLNKKSGAIINKIQSSIGLFNTAKEALEQIGVLKKIKQLTKKATEPRMKKTPNEMVDGLTSFFTWSFTSEDDKKALPLSKGSLALSQNGTADGPVDVDGKFFYNKVESGSVNYETGDVEYQFTNTPAAGTLIELVYQSAKPMVETSPGNFEKLDPELEKNQIEQEKQVEEVEQKIKEKQDKLDNKIGNLNSAIENTSEKKAKIKKEIAISMKNEGLSKNFLRGEQEIGAWLYDKNYTKLSFKVEIKEEEKLYVFKLPEEKKNIRKMQGMWTINLTAGLDGNTIQVIGTRAYKIQEIEGREWGELFVYSEPAANILGILTKGFVDIVEGEFGFVHKGKTFTTMPKIMWSYYPEN